MEYRVKTQKLEQDNAALTQTVQNLKTSLEQGQTMLAQERAARRSALAALQTQNSSQGLALAERESLLRSAQSQNTILLQTLDQTSNELKRVTTENENIRKQIASTLEDRNDLRKRIVSTTDQLYSLESSHVDLQDRNKNLQDELTILEARKNAAVSMLAAAGLPENPEDTPPESVKGVVTAISGKELVEISLGKDDGLRVGHQLEVYRGSQYLGRIVIKRVNDDSAIGEILPGFRRGFIQPNDTVASRI
jgi:chromosome segregation ATPase